MYQIVTTHFLFLQYTDTVEQNDNQELITIMSGYKNKIIKLFIFELF